MKTEWDYTNLADAYLKRPPYSSQGVGNLIKEISKEREILKVCDVGAGTAHLTLELAKFNFQIIAVEPNDAMRKHGIGRTSNFPNVSWFEGTGENTGQKNNDFDLVTFGSSFNVTNRQKTLLEVKRILRPKGWFACMWNHRDLEDPLQSKIESIIMNYVPEYTYGSRREDQTPVINESGLFSDVKKTESHVIHRQKKKDMIEAWKSHGTLYRQAGSEFSKIIEEIEQQINAISSKEIEVPYITRMWHAQLKD